jgi:hypothetical protein
MSPIHREQHTSKDSFWVFQKLARDMEITDEARGFLVNLLSNTDKWNICPREIMKTRKLPRRTVYRLLAYLENAGYITKIWVKVKNDEGKYTSATHYTVFESSETGRLHEDKIPF